MSVIYNFTQNQLKVLLSGCGYSKVSGICLDNSKLDNATVLNTLNELTKMNFITSDGKAFFLDEKIKSIVSTLGTVSDFVAVHSANPFLPDKCCFKGDLVLVCYSRSGNENYISAYFSDVDTLFDDLCDEGYFKEEVYDFQLDDDVLIEYEEKAVSEINPNSPIDANSPIIFSAECVAKQENADCFMRIIDYYFYDYICFSDGGSIVREIYSKSSAKKYFERLLKQNVNG
jgi:hypothetical protein